MADPDHGTGENHYERGGNRRFERARTVHRDLTGAREKKRSHIWDRPLLEQQDQWPTGNIISDYLHRITSYICKFTFDDLSYDVVTMSKEVMADSQ